MCEFGGDLWMWGMWGWWQRGGDEEQVMQEVRFGGVGL